MNNKFIALMIVFLFLNSTFSVAQLNPNINDFTGREDTGESLIIEVVNQEPRIVIANVLNDQNVPVYFNLKATSFGGILGLGDIEVAPFYGTPEVERVVIKPIGDSIRNFAGYNYIPPRRRNFVEDSLVDVLDIGDAINLGTLIVNLRKIEKDNEIPDRIDLDFEAIVDFKLENNLLGIGSQTISFKEIKDEEEWKNSFDKKGFWGDIVYVRVDDIEDDKASIVLYDSEFRRINSLRLKKNEESRPMRLINQPELANSFFRVKLRNIVKSGNKAEIKVKIDGREEIKEIYEGDYIYDGSGWKIKEIILKGSRKGIILSKRGVEDKSIYLSGFLSVPLHDYITRGGGYSWSVTGKGVKVKEGNKDIDFSDSSFDVCVKKAYETYETIINDASVRYQVPVSLIVATICTESNGDKDVVRYEEGWNGDITQTPSKISIGLMQTLFSTAIETYDGNVAEVTLESLKNPEFSIRIGTKYIAEQSKDEKTNFDPVLVAAAYNSGELTKSTKNKWGLVSTGDHISRFVRHYNSFVNSDIGIPEIKALKAYVCENEDYLELDRIDKNTNSEKIYCTTIKNLKELVQLRSDSIFINNIYFLIGENYNNLRDFNNALDYYRKVQSGERYLEAKNRIKDIESNFDESISTYSIKDENVIISLRNVEEGIDADQVGISINSGSIRYYELGKELDNGFYVKDFDDNYIIVGKKGDSEFDDVRISYRSSKAVSEGFVVSYREFITNKEVSLEILPGTGKASSKGTFSVHIPVEDYGISFSDEQIDAQINWTEKSINVMSGIISKLDKIIQWGNGLCWTSWTVFTLRNLFLSPNVKRARALVNHGLDGKGGVYEFCKSQVKTAQEIEKYREDERSNYYLNFDECVFKNRDIIKGLIELTENSYEVTNEIEYNNELTFFEIGDGKEIRLKDSLISSVDLENQARLESIKKGMKEKGMEELGKDSNLYGKFKDEIDGEVINVNKEIRAKRDAYKNATEIVNVISKKKEEISDEELYTMFNEYYFSKYMEEVSKDILFTKDPILQEYNKGGKGNVDYRTVYGKNEEPFIIIDEKGTISSKDLIRLKENSLGEIGLKDKGLIIDDDKNVFTSNKGNIYYYEDGGKFNLVVDPVTNLFGRNIRNDYASTAKNQYYENGKPFCIATGKGNFVKVEEFYTSGSPKTITEWNVGKDGLLCTSDDEPITHKSFLYDNSNRDMINKRAQLERQVNKAGLCKPGENKQLTVPGTARKLGCEHAAARLQNSLDVQCFDIFSIAECQVLFNICDPFMCPASRFNLGGRYPVDNVVQTGLIGSLVLGMPNWAVGIPGISKGSGTAQVIPPVCMTGISSSAKSYRSMLEGYNECLKVSKDQNKNVGICEKIRSVFWCELAWREATGISKAVLKSKSKIDFIDYIRGSGGGEYSDLQTQASYIGDSAEFFTENYANTAFAAYKARSTKEVGSEICKNFFGAKGPEFGKFWDQLTKPESPPQFTAFFDVKPWTTNAGVTKFNRDPMFSGSIQEQNLYSVYYHIYAGEDETVRYAVYLKDPLNRKLFVSGGRIGRQYDTIEMGSYADYTVDVIASTGYNEVCVWINGRTECGFGRASSSFALNRYLNDNLVEGQLDKQINSEDECYSQYTGPGIDVGIGVDIALPFDFGQRAGGVRRYCNVGTPDGKEIVASKYKRVGSCGEDREGRALGDCWIDLDSVKESLYSLDKIENVRYRQFSVSEYKISLVYEEILNDFNDLKSEYNNDEDEENKVEYRELIVEFVELNDLETYLENVNSDSSSKYGEITFMDILYYAYDTKEAQKSFGNILESFEMLMDTARLILEAPVVETSNSKEKDIDYKVVLVTSGLFDFLEFLTPDVSFEWNGNYWSGSFNYDNDRNIIRIESYEEGLNKIKEVINNLKKVKVNSLKLYCGNEKESRYNLNNLDKISEGLKTNAIISWIKVYSEKCLEDLKGDDKQKKEGDIISRIEIKDSFISLDKDTKDFFVRVFINEDFLKGDSIKDKEIDLSLKIINVNNEIVYEKSLLRSYTLSVGAHYDFLIYSQYNFSDKGGKLNRGNPIWDAGVYSYEITAKKVKTGEETIKRGKFVLTVDLEEEFSIKVSIDDAPLVDIKLGEITPLPFTPYEVILLSENTLKFTERGIAIVDNTKVIIDRGYGEEIHETDEEGEVFLGGSLGESLPYNEYGHYFVLTDDGFEIFFDYDSFDVTQSIEDIQIYFEESVLRDRDFKKIEILGYTSEEGSNEYNLGLSRRRSEAVSGIIKEELIINGRLKFLGIPSYLIFSVPKGETTEFGNDLYLNRKVIVKFIEDESFFERGEGEICELKYNIDSRLIGDLFFKFDKNKGYWEWREEDNEYSQIPPKNPYDSWFDRTVRYPTYFELFNNLIGNEGNFEKSLYVIKNIAKRESDSLNLIVGDCGILSEEESVVGKFIVIDPGHGGRDPGAIYGGLYESYIVYDIATELESELKNEGFEVYLTRKKESKPSFTERSKIANNNNADLFISLHVDNFSPCPIKGGTHALYYYTAPKSIVAGDGGLDSTYLKIPSVLVEDKISSSKIKERVKRSYEIADKILIGLELSQIGLERRYATSSIRASDSSVLAGLNNIPGILLEMGFLCNENDRNILINKKGAIANSIADSIKESFEEELLISKN